MRAASPKSATTVRKTPLGSFWIRQFCGSGREGEGGREGEEGGRERREEGRGGREGEEGGREGEEGGREGRREGKGVREGRRREQWRGCNWTLSQDTCKHDGGKLILN